MLGRRKSRTEGTDFLNKKHTAEILDRMVDLVRVYPPPMPTPLGAPWDTPSDRQQKWEQEDALAVSRLLQLGATPEDLNAFARGVRALAIADVLSALDPQGEGELNGEFYGTYLGLPDP